MSETDKVLSARSAESAEGPKVARIDPWHASTYLIGGLLLYGVLGWLLDRWQGTSYFVAVGILFGASLGIYRTVKSLGVLGPARIREQNTKSNKAKSVQ